MTRGPNSLSDHVATLSAYLNDYKKTTDPKIQDDYSRKLNCYLLSACWKKIFKRISSWRATGFIRFLAYIQVDELRTQGEQWGQFPSHTQPGDKTLISLLMHSQPDQPLFKEMQSLLNASRLKSSAESSPPPFSEDTILEFHALAIAIFTGFARAFKEIQFEFSKLVRMDYQALEM